MLSKKALLYSIATALSLLFVVRVAYAVFTQSTTSLSNNLSTGTLNLGLTGIGFNDDLVAGASATKSITIGKSGSLDFNYRLQAAVTGGNTDFCNNLTLEAKLEGDTKHNSSISFTSDNFSWTEDDWEFVVTLANGYGYIGPPPAPSCEFSFTFSAWQENSDGSWGFIDQEALTNVVTYDPGVPACFPFCGM